MHFSGQLAARTHTHTHKNRVCFISFSCFSFSLCMYSRGRLYVYMQSTYRDCVFKTRNLTIHTVRGTKTQTQNTQTSICLKRKPSQNTQTHTNTLFSTNNKPMHLSEAGLCLSKTIMATNERFCTQTKRKEAPGSTAVGQRSPGGQRSKQGSRRARHSSVLHPNYTQLLSLI